jgi:hypothetical protein
MDAIKQAIEALEKAGALISWQFFGECRAYGPLQTLPASEVDSAIRSALSALRAQQDTKDGERYRWLRDWLLQGRERSEIMPEGHYRFYTTAEVDAAIDAARGADRG